jgi:hypothetical protein
LRVGEGGADDGNDGAEMFAAGELGNDTAIARVGGDLRSDSGGDGARAAFDDRGGGFVARGFDAKDEASVWHILSVVVEESGARKAGELASWRKERSWKMRVAGCSG